MHWLRMLFVWRGSVLPRILPQLAFTTALAAAVVWSHGYVGAWKPTLTATPFTLFGVALAIFLGFRNNASYERFWDARKIWGGLLNDIRSLARQVCTLIDGSPEEHRELVYILIAYVHALRHQLRGSDARPDLNQLLITKDAERVAHAHFKPAVLLILFSERLTAARKSGKVEPILAASFEPQLNGLSHAIGGCERIANTPIPFTYSVIIHRIVYIYCFMLPFGLVDTVGIMTPLVVAFVAYTFFALEALSDEIEEPFGTMPNDLALDAMALTIEATLRESIGESPLPAPAVADKNFVLR